MRRAFCASLECGRASHPPSRSPIRMHGVNGREIGSSPNWPAGYPRKVSIQRTLNCNRLVKELSAARVRASGEAPVMHCARQLPLRGSCPEAWCSNGVAEQGQLLDQAARDGRLTVRLSLSGAMVSSVM
jgi:hypothetical protein